MGKELLDKINQYNELWKRRKRTTDDRYEEALRTEILALNDLIKNDPEIRMIYGDKPIPQALCYDDDLPFDILPYESRIDDGVPYEQRIRRTSSNLTLIDKLHNTGKEENLINAFKSAFGDIRACYSFKGHYQGELVLRKEISSGVVVRAFYLRDNDCVPTSQVCNIDYRSKAFWTSPAQLFILNIPTFCQCIFRHFSLFRYQD